MTGNPAIGSADRTTAGTVGRNPSDPHQPVLIEPSGLLGPEPHQTPLQSTTPRNHGVLLTTHAHVPKADDADHPNLPHLIGETAQLLSEDHVGEHSDDVGRHVADPTGPRSVPGLLSELGPYRAQDYHEFRARHYQSAGKVVESLKSGFGNTLTAHQVDQLDTLAQDLRSLGREATNKAAGAQPDEPNSLQALREQVVGGTHETQRGWLRCLFSRNARRARTIQKRAEAGQPFDEIYTGNKLQHIHPKAALALYLRGRLKHAGLGNKPGTSTAELSKKLSTGYRDLTEKSQAWSTYSRVHTFSGKPAAGAGAAPAKVPDMESRLTPASELAALKDTFQNGTRGISSMNSKDKQHAANLWKTEFRPVGEAGATLSFAGFRHGVLDAYGIKNDATERKAANVEKASELVRAAASEMPAAIKQSDSGEWTIPMVSVSLQTAGTGGDNDMIAAQDEALRTVARNGVLMANAAPDGSPGPWRLKPNCIQFYVGVNQLALTSLARNTNRGHWNSKFGQRNDDAIQQLLARAQRVRSDLQYEAGMTHSAALYQKIRLIDELQNQIAALKLDRSFSSLDTDPYKLAPRVLLLASLLDNVPCFNCKSGKDRTGVVDIETKALVQSINRNIALNGASSDQPLVPPYGVARTDQQKQDFKELHVWGGGQHVSRANTGLMGNKTNIGSYLRDNLDEHTVDLISGFARHADGNK